VRSVTGRVSPLHWRISRGTRRTDHLVCRLSRERRLGEPAGSPGQKRFRLLPSLRLRFDMSNSLHHKCNQVLATTVFELSF